MELVAGLDAGGTKTLAVVAGSDGQVRGEGRAGPANFQACGQAGARRQLESALAAALRQAGAGSEDLRAAAFAVAGADRPADFATIEAFTRPLVPGARYLLENDSLAALRAGTADGVGVALVAGTGANAVGRDAGGRLLQVGGLGRLSGDHGSAWHLGEQAVIAAMRARDGRGPATRLQEDICRQLGLADIQDIIEFEFYDHQGPPLDLGSLAPLVFNAAADGDAAARDILHSAGVEMAGAARVIIERLFPAPAAVTVVLGGAVLQHGADSLLVDTISERLRRYCGGRLRFARLAVEPVVGAVAFACDLVRPGGGLEVVQRLAAGLTARRSATAGGDD